MNTLRKVLASEVRHFLKHPLLVMVRQSQLTPGQFRIFSMQRHLATGVFLPLLVAAKNFALEAGEQNLAAVLEDNWRDETGNQPNITGYGSQAHSVWREDYLRALGLDSHELATPYLGVRCYQRKLEEIAASGDYLSAAGALLFLEASISPEYTLVRKCRDALFPETFVVLPQDNQNMREQKKRASMYINDHEKHDRERHLPDLHKVLVHYEGSSQSFYKLVQSIATTANAKIELYNGIQQAVLQV